MTKKTPNPATAPRRRPINNRAQYRQAVIRLVGRQLDCARRGLIGSPEWLMAYAGDAMHISVYARQARIPAPSVRFFQGGTSPDGRMEWPDEWIGEEGVPINHIPTEPPSRRRIVIPATDGRLDAAVLRAVNLAAAHVYAEWLDWIETADERVDDDDMMPAAYFEPITQASPASLRKWRDVGKIDGTKFADGREVVYGVTSVLKHLKLPVRETRQMLDEAWLETLAPDLAKRKDEVRERVTGESAAENRGMPRSPTGASMKAVQSAALLELIVVADELPLHMRKGMATPLRSASAPQKSM
jgi:hypothetical protein